MTTSICGTSEIDNQQSFTHSSFRETGQFDDDVDSDEDDDDDDDGDDIFPQLLCHVIHRRIEYY